MNLPPFSSYVHLLSHSCVLDCNLGHHIQRAAMRLSPVNWLDKSLVASAWLPKPAVGSFKVASYHQHNLHHPNDYDGHHSRPLKREKASSLAQICSCNSCPNSSTTPPIHPSSPTGRQVTLKNKTLSTDHVFGSFFNNCNYL